MKMKFYLGIHQPSMIGKSDIPMFVSINRLWGRKKKFPIHGDLAIDSGGFSQLRLNGQWTKTPQEYLNALNNLNQLGLFYEWAAPQDWMVEPFMLERTGLTIEDHQIRTVENYLELSESNPRIIPVLQGWNIEDYFHCFELYESRGVDLRSEDIVGVGSVCRRQGQSDIEHIMRSLHSKGLKLHGFGVKTKGLERYSDCLTSVDSLAWSFEARYRPENKCQLCINGSHRKNCANCLEYGIEWRSRILDRLEASI
tara:strand:- start:816 stop:1577 length:762 start_codon:yes stop_codon:yes gene_type:complete